MIKYWVLIAATIGLSGCKTVSDAGAGQALTVQSPKPAELNAGTTTDKTNAFVRVFGEKTQTGAGMQVKFGAEGTVTVDGKTTTASGTYTASGREAEATFNKTNVARFDKVTFKVSEDGNTLAFAGPLNTRVTLKRTQ
jgi:hypothetical protein